jgi:hypothetical protein
MMDLVYSSQFKLNKKEVFMTNNETQSLDSLNNTQFIAFEHGATYEQALTFTDSIQLMAFQAGFSYENAMNASALFEKATEKCIDLSMYTVSYSQGEIFVDCVTNRAAIKECPNWTITIVGFDEGEVSIDCETKTATVVDQNSGRVVDMITVSYHTNITDQVELAGDVECLLT